MKTSSPSGVGGITVFMVLAVLIIAVFSVLTLTSAVADSNLSAKNAALTTAYYKGDGLGVELLAALTEVWPQGASLPPEEAFLAAADELGIPLTVLPQENGVGFACVIEVDDLRYMEIEAVLAPEGDQRWHIEKWLFLSADSVEIDGSLPVWQFGS